MLTTEYNYQEDINENRQEAWEEGFIKGFQEGFEKEYEGGREEGKLRKLADNIKTLSRKLNQTAEQTMDLLEVPESDRAKILEML